MTDLSATAVKRQETSMIGSNVGTYYNQSEDRPVRWIQACWNGEVIKGFAFKFHGEDRQYEVGDWNNSGKDYHRSSLEIAEGDVLKVFKISTSAFGYGSVRGVLVELRSGKRWEVGNVTDPYSELDVADRSLMGFFGYCNPDQFINGLGLWVTT